MEGKKKTKKAFIKKLAVGNKSIEAAMSSLSKKGVLANAAGQAIKKQFAENLPAIYTENGAVYRVFPDGTKELIKKLRTRRVKADKKTAEV